MSTENVFSPEAMYSSFSRSQKFDHEKNRALANSLKAISETLSQDSVLSPTQRQALQEQQQELKKELVCGNVWLVVSVAHMFMRNYYDRKDIHIEDLIQEGMFGLFKAIEKYDPARKARFSTYAVRWIKNSISRFLQEDGVIKVPVWEQWLLNKKAKDPTEPFTAVQEVTLICALNALIVHELDAPMLEESDSTYMEASTYDSAVFESIDFLFFDERVSDILETVVTAKEAIVIKLYFGFNNNEPLVFEEIGERLGVTRQRAHQIFDDGMKKLETYFSAHNTSITHFWQ